MQQGEAPERGKHPAVATAAQEGEEEALHGALLEALVAMDRITAARLVLEHRNEHGILAVCDQLITPCLELLGEAWDRGEASLAQTFVAARICEELVTPFLGREEAVRKEVPRIGIAVLEDGHSLGKRIVSAVLRAAGHSLRDYGSALEKGVLADKAMEHSPDVLLVSTLMLRSALQVEGLVDGLRARGFRGRILVGGAPFRFDPELWREVGADGMGRTASDALTLVADLKGGKA